MTLLSSQLAFVEEALELTKHLKQNLAETV